MNLITIKFAKQIKMNDLCSEKCVTHKTISNLINIKDHFMVHGTQTPRRAYIRGRERERKRL